MATTPVITGHFVLLRAGPLRLLLPQASVGAAEYRDPALDTRAVVAPSGHLRRLDAVPPGRFVVTQLASASGEALWYAWDEVRVLIGATLTVHSLPAALRSVDSPVSGWVEIGEEVALLADADAVVAHLHAEPAEVEP